MVQVFLYLAWTYLMHVDFRVGVVGFRFLGIALLVLSVMLLSVLLLALGVGTFVIVSVPVLFMSNCGWGTGISRRWSCSVAHGFRWVFQRDNSEVAIPCWGLSQDNTMSYWFCPGYGCVALCREEATLPSGFFCHGRFSYCPAGVQALHVARLGLVLRDFVTK